MRLLVHGVVNALLLGMLGAAVSFAVDGGRPRAMVLAVTMSVGVTVLEAGAERRR